MPEFNETIDFIIGTPPVNARDTGPSPGQQTPGPDRKQVINNAMPIVHIQPGIPDFTKGLDLMFRNPAFSPSSSTVSNSYSGDIWETYRGGKGTYVELLAGLGFALKQPKPGVSNHLTCAYLADSFPTDTFTNEYGENFLQKITNVGGEGLHSVAQMLGVRSVGQFIEKGKQMGGMIGGLFEGAGRAGEEINKLVNTLPASSGIQRIAANMSHLLAGGRIDFPMLWKNSTYAPSYTMTIRLYNPNPNSKRSTAKYIIGPVAALLLLGLPQAQGAGAYSWPFIHKFWSPGIYNLDPGYIANITVIKGGDQQQISWKQTMGVVDVRIDFGSIFNSILTNASSSRNRPTLSGYLHAMADEKSDVYGLTDFSKVNNEENQSPASIERTKNLGTNSGGITNKEVLHWSSDRAGQRADLATTQSKTQSDITEPGETIPARIQSDIKQIADDLIDLIPGGVRVIF